MRENTVREAWRAGKATVGGWLSLPDSFAAEVMAHQGFDWLTVDMQHGLIDYSSAVPMLQAISTTDTIPLVRVPWNDPPTIMKALDAGAYGVIVPLVNNRAEAERAVGAARYPPRGYRSNGPVRGRYYGGADYNARAHETIIVALMVETREGLENVEEIAAVDGVDAIYVGPSDLGYALGMAPKLDNDEPQHVAAVERIRDACKRHGIVAGIHTGGPAYSARWIERGFQMVTVTSDEGSMVRGVQAQLKELRERLGRDSAWSGAAAG
jgi:4-hydroxy-2-oxoheptanedioate aldolase